MIIGHSPTMNSFLLSIFVAFTAVPSLAQEVNLKEAFIKDDNFHYNKYVIERTFEKWKQAPMGKSLIAVMRGKKHLVKINGCCFRESTRYALLPLLGNNSKQLVVEAYSGGGHCCTSYYIFDLTGRFRKLFDGNDYSSEDVGYSMALVDINNDGVYEFVQSVMNFDYFYTAHARSVFPEVVFAYNTAAGKYLLSNAKYVSYLLRNIDEKKKVASRLNENGAALSRIIGGRGSEKTLDDAQLRSDYFYNVIGVVLAYVYSGRLNEGWKYFDQNYRLHDKEQLRRDMQQTLRTSQIYNRLYLRRTR